METDTTILAADDPRLAVAIKGYNGLELGNLETYIDDTLAWMQTSYGDIDLSEDVVAFRIGIPYLGSDSSVDASTVYTSDDSLDRLISTIGLDFVKFTVKENALVSSSDIVRQSVTYTYKSQHIHRIFGNLFIEGINNVTGYTYLDDFDVNPSNKAYMKVEYNDVNQLPLPTKPLPDYVVKCAMYLSQNMNLLNNSEGVNGEDRVKKGDVIYHTVKQVFDALVIVKSRIGVKTQAIVDDDPLNRSEAIALIFETTELGEGFKALDFGGLIEDLRLLIRIPASRANQEELERLVTYDEVFSDVFKEEWVALSSKDVDEHIREQHLKDVYSTDSTHTGVPLDDVYNGYYGCKNGGLYRFFRVSDEWYDTITPEKMAIIFYSGLDLIMENDTDPCPFDVVIIVIAIIVITVLTWGKGTGPAVAAGNALLLASAIISIASVLGVIDTKTSTVLTIIVALLSIYNSLITEGFKFGLNNATMQFVISMANLGLTVVNMIEDENFQSEMEAIEEEMAQIEADDASEWESQIKLILGGYQDLHISNGSQMDYEKPMKDMYAKFSTYPEKGFRNQG